MEGGLKVGTLNWKNNADVDKESKILEFKQYLQETDFYYIRRLDSGDPIPQAIADKRLQIRKALKDLGL